MELAGYRLTAVGVGTEIGASLGQTKGMYRGFFYAPHTVAQALKTHALCGRMSLRLLGFEAFPRWDERAQRHHPDAPFRRAREADCLLQGHSGRFARSIPSSRPSRGTCPATATPSSWRRVRLFGGSSIELSADGPIRPPYTAYLQGGLTYESGKIGILRAAEEILKL